MGKSGPFDKDFPSILIQPTSIKAVISNVMLYPLTPQLQTVNHDHMVPWRSTTLYWKVCICAFATKRFSACYADLFLNPVEGHFSNAKCPLSCPGWKVIGNNLKFNCAQLRIPICFELLLVF